MGQKTNPIGNRLGFIQGWDSNWYGGEDYRDKLVEDDKIRRYLRARLSRASIAKIIIERTLKLVTVTINTARPGVIIGKGGQEVDKLKEELKKLTKKEIQINIFEVKRPELDARLVADGIARQLEARISFRRAIKNGYREYNAHGSGRNQSKDFRTFEWCRDGSFRNVQGWDVLRYIRSELTLIMRWQKLTQLTVALVSRFGSVKVKFTVKRDLSPNVGQASGKGGGKAPRWR